MTNSCKKCGAELATPLRYRVASWPLIAIGLVLAIPSVGISLVAAIYGVFMREPRCPNCG